MTARESDERVVNGASTAASEPTYDFERYVTKHRILTFWYQLAEIIRLDAQSVLEVGVGPRVVTGVLREFGKDLKTADIDPAVKPDYVVPVQKLSSVLPADAFDLVLCARVLHYVPLEELDQALAELHTVTRRYLILTVPVDELRVYLGARVTSEPARWLSLRLPLALKRFLFSALRVRATSEYAKSWKLNSSPESALSVFEARLRRLFTIEKSYALPEVREHRLFVLRKRV